MLPCHLHRGFSRCIYTSYFRTDIFSTRNFWCVHFSPKLSFLTVSPLIFREDSPLWCRSQWPRGLRRRSAATRLLRSWVWIPPEAWMCCLLWVLCVVRWRSLRRADHSPRGLLPTVVRRCVWSRNLRNEEAMTRVGSQRHKKNPPEIWKLKFNEISSFNLQNSNHDQYFKILK